MKHVILLFLITLTQTGEVLAQGLSIEQTGNPNKWILHNPNTTTQADQNLAIAPWSQTANTWNWSKGSVFRAGGGLSLQGAINAQQGTFSSFYSGNTDGAYPTNVVNQLGAGQLSIGANWTGGYTDLSLINSNIGNTSGGGFSFWQMTGATAKRPLVYFQGNGLVGIGKLQPETTLDVAGTTTSEYLILRPQGGKEGGEMRLKGGTGYADWQMDVYEDRLRLHAAGAEWFHTAPTQTHLASSNILLKGHVYLYANEGFGQSGTAYMQARDYGTSSQINLQFRTQNGSSVVEAMRIMANGNVGIGTIDPGSYKLAVDGKVGAREIEVKVGSWSDFVFTPSYRLRPLPEVGRFIREHGHLPDIPSEAEVKATGYSVGEMDAKLLQKIEELTLYVLRLQAEVEALKNNRVTTAKPE